MAGLGQSDTSEIGLFQHKVSVEKAKLDKEAMDNRSVFIGNVDYSTTEDELKVFCGVVLIVETF